MLDHKEFILLSKGKENSMSSKCVEVAEIIRKQIGHSALYMLGAQYLAAIDEEQGGLQFRVRGSASGYANYIRIILTDMDLYRVEGKRIWGNKVKDIKSYEGVYNDMLHKIIEELTGLYTSL